MKSLVIALFALAVTSAPVTIKTALVQPRVLSGMEIQIVGDQVTVQPGVCRIGANTVKAGKATIQIAPAPADAMRLDALCVSADGKVTLVGGKPEKTTPHPPEVGENSLRLANIFMPAGARGVAVWQLYVIGDSLPDPDEQTLALRTTLVSKTLDRLRHGQSVTIVAWGGSVTAGAGASAREKAYPQLLAARLTERFPKSAISVVNAGIADSNSSQRIAGLEKEVVSHRPDLVTVEFGADAALSDDAVRQSMESAFQQIRAAGGEIILITPNLTAPPMMNAKLARGGETRHIVQFLRQLAEEKSVALADVSRRWEHLEKDGIPYPTLLQNGVDQPDDRGHELFVKELMTFFPAESSLPNLVSP